MARHDYDQSTGAWSIPSHVTARPTLDHIMLAYRQASLAERESWSAPADVGLSD